jgi:hypothetical protein
MKRWGDAAAFAGAEVTTIECLGRLDAEVDGPAPITSKFRVADL